VLSCPNLYTSTNYCTFLNSMCNVTTSFKTRQNETQWTEFSWCESFFAFTVVQLRSVLRGCNVISLGDWCPVFQDHQCYLYASGTRHPVTQSLLILTSTFTFTTPASEACKCILPLVWMEANMRGTMCMCCWICELKHVFWHKMVIDGHVLADLCSTEAQVSPTDKESKPDNDLYNYLV
jgi:hypothetical protein